MGALGVGHVTLDVYMIGSPSWLMFRNSLSFDQSVGVVGRFD